MVLQPVQCFALTKKFLFKEIFPKYPDMANILKSEALLRYKKYIKEPITAH